MQHTCGFSVFRMIIANLVIIQPLAMQFLEWRVGLIIAHSVTAVFHPLLDSGNTIVCVGKETLTAANWDSSATVDGDFEDRRT